MMAEWPYHFVNELIQAVNLQWAFNALCKEEITVKPHKMY